jgi:chromosomal replication initiator protein
VEMWNTVLAELQKEIPAPLYRAFIEPVRAHVSEDVLHLDVPDEKKLRHIQKHYIGSIERAFRKQVSHGRISLLQSAIKADPAESTPSDLPSRPSPAAVQAFYPHPLNQSVVEQLLLLRFPSPVIYIEGRTASGKTVLLANLESRARTLGWKVERFTLEAFISDFAIACRNKASVDFRQARQSNHLLLIDDLQYLKQTAVQTQEEIRHLLENAGAQGPTVVLTSDLSPENLPLRPDLLSRLRGAYRVRLALPDEATRLKLFVQFCSEAEVKPDAESLRRVRTVTDARELRGLAMHLAAGIQLEQKGGFGVPELISAASEFLRVRLEDIQGSSKDRAAVHARHMVIYICKTRLGMGPSEIARALGRRHHTSILYALERAETLVRDDMFFAGQVEELISRVRH